MTWKLSQPVSDSRKRPTTLLAEQHYQNFSDRFADWPVKVAEISRFKSKQEQDAAVALLASGKIDILIGTHRLLQPDVKFERLGLVIIDEEHRFGVRQKEALKALRAEVDVLTLTATPIPRTLGLSLEGLRFDFLARITGDGAPFAPSLALPIQQSPSGMTNRHATILLFLNCINKNARCQHDI